MFNIHRQIQKTVLFILCIGEINLNLRQVPLEQVHHSNCKLSLQDRTISTFGDSYLAASVTDPLGYFLNHLVKNILLWQLWNLATFWATFQESSKNCLNHFRMIFKTFVLHISDCWKAFGVVHFKIAWMCDFWGLIFF